MKRLNTRFFLLAALLIGVLLLAGVIFNHFSAKDSEQEIVGRPQVKADLAQATPALEEQINSATQVKLGEKYFKGDGVPKDDVEAVKWFRKAIDQGNPDAEEDLGFMYYTGEGIAQDYTEAFKLFHKAAEQSVALAQFNLAVMYQQGEGMAKDYVEALKWYTKAADQNDVGAELNLAFMYYTGDGVPKNSTEAVKWFRKAADQGDAKAQGALGVMYQHGESVAQNNTEAVRWYRKAAEQNDDNGQYNLAFMYYNGEGVPKDTAEAVKWFREAANQGDSDAQSELGWIYGTGDGVPRDLAEAVKWYLKAANQNDITAQFYLGWFYTRGDGVPKDSAEAVKWYGKAANQGDPDAQYNIGALYVGAEGLQANYIEAYKWFNISAAEGNAQGAKARDRLALVMTPEQIAEAQQESSAFVAHEETPETTTNSNDHDVFSGEMQRPKASGSGFFITDDGYFLTCYHVVQGATELKLRTSQGTFAATVIKADSDNDVALLKISGTFHSLSVIPSEGVKLADSVFTIGYPDPLLQGLSPKFTKGEISSLNGIQDDPTEFQISVPVQHGNSGGPLVDLNGNVVGMIEAILSDTAAFDATGAIPQNVNYATKGSILMTFLQNVPEISTKLKTPNSTKSGNTDSSVPQVEQSVAMVLVY